MISVPWHERVIYLRYDIALRAMIYAFGIWRNGYYIMLAAGKYIIRQRRISYCASDISLKSTKPSAARTVVEGAFLRSVEKLIILWYNLFGK